LAGQQICHSCYSRLSSRLRALNFPRQKASCCNPACTSKVVRGLQTCKSEWDRDLVGQKIYRACYDRFKRLAPKDPNAPKLTCANPDCVTEVVCRLLTYKTEWSKDLAGQKICESCYNRFRRLAPKDPITCANPNCVTGVVRKLLTCKAEWSQDLAGQKICESCYDRFKRLAPKDPITCANPNCVTGVVRKLLTCKAEWSQDLSGLKICEACYNRFQRRAHALLPKDPNLGPKVQK
jgi:hypothetical protein